MQVVVRVVGRDADELLRGPGEGAAPALEPVTRRAGVNLAPQHPGAADPDLRRWFVAEVGDRVAAEQLAAELRSVAGVEAAYVKPEEELPAPP